MRVLSRLTACLIALVLTASTAVLVVRRDDGAAVRTSGRVQETTTTELPTTQPPATEPPTTAPPPTTQPPPTEPPTTEPPTTAAPAPMIAAAAPAVPGAYTVDPYVGLGAWIDVYDWSVTYGGGAVGVDDIDRMASLGVQTLYVQATRWDADTLVLEPDRLLTLLRRAHADGLRVVAWYLPDLGDGNTDLERLTAITQLPIDGLAVDIESRKVAGVADRNQRLLDLSAALRRQLPGYVLSAIVLPPVLMEDVNPNYWPDYPWAGLAQYFDVWQPMSYWTNRIGGWRDAYTYTAANVDRIRAHVANPHAIVHTIGGIGDQTTTDDLGGMAQAAVDRSCVGASIYDYRTTGDDLWPGLQTLRR